MSWLQRLKAGLSRSSNRLVEGIGHALTARKLDDAALGEIEEALIAADLGPMAAARLTDLLRSRKFPGDVDSAAVRDALATEIATLLLPAEKPFTPDPARKPH